MKSLDLHGYKHNQAEDKIRMFFNFEQPPFEVITGNSSQMKTIVRKLVKEYDWHSKEKNSFNAGSLIITEREVR